MGHETHMLVHVPSRSYMDLAHGVYGPVLQRILGAMGWSLADVAILDDRWDEMPSNLADLGVPVPDGWGSGSDWFAATWTCIRIEDVVPGVTGGRTVVQ